MRHSLQKTGWYSIKLLRHKRQRKTKGLLQMETKETCQLKTMCNPGSEKRLYWDI